MIPISFTITTCNRLDLLSETLDSFFKLNTYPIDEFIMSDDSGDENVFNTLNELYGDKFKIIQNKPKIGLSSSIDNLFTKAKNEYIFHCEDDWNFNGNPNFISNSLDILIQNPNIHHIWIRHQSDLVKQLPQYSHLITENNYKMIPTINQWNGFSFNPGLRRKSDYLKMFPDGISNIGNETNCAIYTSQFNYKAVLLTDTSCQHIGYNKRTKNFIH